MPQQSAGIAKTLTNAQILKVTANQLFLDANSLLGSVNALSISINAGTATVADVFEMERIIGNLNGQLISIDNQILTLIQQTNG